MAVTKKQSVIHLTHEAKTCLRELSNNKGLTQSAVVEVLIREEFEKQRKLEYERQMEKEQLEKLKARLTKGVDA